MHCMESTNGPSWRIAAGAMLLACIASPMAGADDAAQLPRTIEEAQKIEALDALPRTAFYDDASLARTRPGALLRSEPASGYTLPEGARAVRILYHSVDSLGQDVATSGVVLVPAGKAPKGGWPVIAWAHGTTGVARQCAPSLMKDLVYGEEGLMPMVRAGFAVVATDYHGLGTSGEHQYVNKVAQARDVIHSVPAAHAAVPGLAADWVAIGHSQGGLATWGVAELEAQAHDPHYRGAISVAGAAEFDALLPAMAQARGAAAFYLPYMAYAVHAAEPGFDVSRLLEGMALERYDDVTHNGCWYYAFARFQDDDGKPLLRADWLEAPEPRRFFDGNRQGVAPVRGPLLVVAGEGDRTVPFAGVQQIVRRACTNHVPLEFRTLPKLDHDETMAQGTPMMLDWVRDRLAGKPATDSCPAIMGAAAPGTAPAP